MNDKPTAAFVLGLIAGILGLIFGAAIGVIATLGGIAAIVAAPMGGLHWLGGALIALGFWWVIAAVLIIIGSFMINSGIPDKVRTGGILVLVFSILSIPNWITLILGVVGGALALAWKPSQPVLLQSGSSSQT
jgi:hypothetical protein